MSKESYTHTLQGGTIETQYTGHNDGDSGVNIRPNFSSQSGTVEVRGDGTVVDRGPVHTNGANLKSSGPIYYTENGARRIDASKATDSCVVEVNGVKMMLGAAKRMGLITDDGTGKLNDTSKEAVDQMQQEGQEQEGEAPVSFATPETDGMLTAMDEAIGRDATIQVANSAIGHLTSLKWESPEQAMEAAGKSLANRTGVDPQVAIAAVNEAYQGYYAQCEAHLNKMGVDAQEVLDFASTCSQTVRADIMRAVLLGRGPQAMKNLVQRYKTRNKQ